MKVALFFYDMHIKAGIQKSLGNNAISLLELGHEVTIIVGEYQSPAFELPKNIKIENLGIGEPILGKSGLIPKLLYLVRKLIWIVIAYVRLSKLVKKHEYDVIVDNGTLLGLFYPFSRLKKTKYALYRHFSINEFPSAKILNKYWSWVGKTKLFIVLDELYKNELHSLGVKFVWVVQNYNDNKATKSKFSVASKSILGVGRPTKQKGFKLLIDAFIAVNLSEQGWQLNLVGPGMESSELAKDAAGCENIHLYNSVADLSEFYAEATIFCMPSLWEGVPFVLIEALDFSRPLLLSNINIFKSITHDGEFGVLFDLEDSQSLGEKLLEYTGSDKKLVNYSEMSSRLSEKYSKSNSKGCWSLVLKEI